MVFQSVSMETIRKVHWTEEEYTLTGAIQAAEDVLRGTGQSADMNKKKTRLWKDVMKKINSIHGNNRDVKEVNKKWNSLKGSQMPVWIAAVGKRGEQKEGQMKQEK